MNRSLRIAARLLFAGVLALGALTSKAQLKVGDNPTNIQRSAVLELESTRQGLLLPRLTDTTAINALSPLDGMIIYFSDGVTPGPNRGLYVRKFGHWERMADASVASGNWTLTGNAGTNPATNYIGTSDAQALSIRTNATEAIRVTGAGNVELKTVSAGAATDVEVLVIGAGGSVMRRTMPSAAFTNVISSINGDLTPAQTLEVDSAGMDFNIVHNGTGEHRFNIPTQDGTKTRGLLTMADWNRINAAQKAIVIGTFSTTPVATGLTLDAAGNLVLHAADATNPGAVSIGAQTFAGAKTFQNDLTASANLNVTGNTVLGGTATVNGATTLNGPAALNGATTLAGATTLSNTLTATNPFPAAAAAENNVLIRAASGVISQKTLNDAAFNGAVQSINGQTGPAVHFKNGTAGTDVAFDSTSTANIITLNVPDAAVAARGVVTTGTQAFAGAKEYRDSVMIGGIVKPNSTLQVNGSVSMAIRTVTTNTTITEADNTILVNTTGGVVTITLPAAGTIAGRIYTIKKIAGGLDNEVNITSPAQIEGGAAGGTYKIYNDWTFVTLQTDGTNWYIIKK